MILIVAKFRVRPEHRYQWLERVDGFTEATPGGAGELVVRMVTQRRPPG